MGLHPLLSPIATKRTRIVKQYALTIVVDDDVSIIRLRGKHYGFISNFISFVK